jgi:hypothetical protein
MNKKFLPALLFLVTASCEKPLISGAAQIFSPTAEKYNVQPVLIDEVSGIVESRTIEGHLWVEEDGGNSSQINLISSDGKLVKRIELPFPDRDWEDLGIGPGPESGVSYLYMADIGDNDAKYNECYIYRFIEPKNENESVIRADKITFQYPDGARDAETILVDPVTKDILIVSKRETKVHLYKLPYPQSVTEIIKATYLGELPIYAATGGSISFDGSEILIRTYLDANYWHRSAGQNLDDLLLHTAPTRLAIEEEPQGEAVAFSNPGSGFYTISEKASAKSVSLNFYKRL